MPFQIIKENILNLSCDVLIDPTDESFSGSGGLDAQIHLAAGPELDEECALLAPLAAGEAVLTQLRLENGSYIIHTVAPWWSGGEDALLQLRRCYHNSLALAAQAGFARIALPLIGSGTRGFPKDLVLRTAAEEIESFLTWHEDTLVLLVIHDRSEFQPDPALLAGLEEYIHFLREEEWKEQAEDAMLSMASTGAFPPITAGDIEEERRRQNRPSAPPQLSAPQAMPGAAAPPPSGKRRDGTASRGKARKKTDKVREKAAEKPDLVQPFGMFRPDRDTVLDESFSQMVLRKIAEKGFTKDSECYLRANVDRRVFSKLRCDAGYHPKKTTALALAIALELSLPETNELLMKAGYSLSHSILFDVIVEYCILQQNYNIFEINELLFDYDQPLLGG